MIDAPDDIDDASDFDAIVDSWRRVPHAFKMRVEAILRFAEGDTGGPPMTHERKEGCAWCWCLMYARPLFCLIECKTAEQRRWWLSVRGQVHSST